MPEVTVKIGGREFQVACEAGQEDFLLRAAEQLDREASELVSQVGRIPEATMLLMSGLMLADRTVREADRVAHLEEQISGLKEELEELRNMPMPKPEQVPVEVVPEAVQRSLFEIADRAEELADRMEAQAAGDE